MKLIIFLSILIMSVWSKKTPPHPDFSPTCSFMFKLSTKGDPSQPPLRTGYCGTIYTKDESKRMQVINSTAIFDETKREHNFVLDRMDMGKDFSMNWGKSMPTECEQSNKPVVADIWDELKKYVFEDTKTIDGIKMNIWKYEIAEGELLRIGVSVDDNTVPLFLAEEIKQDHKVVSIRYTFSGYSKNPDKSIFDVPEICQKGTINDSNTSQVERKSRLFSLF